MCGNNGRIRERLERARELEKPLKADFLKI